MMPQLLASLLLLVTLMFSEAHATRAVRFFELLKHTKGQFAGKSFDLLPWQKTIVQDVYGTVNAHGLRQYKYAYIEVPKKNGKSELAAGASLFHLHADGEINGEVYGCAADREQASIVFDVAVDMIDQVPALKKITKPQLAKKRLINKKTGTFYQVLSAEAFTKHGLNLSACIFDELHAQPNRALWDVMTHGAGDARAQPLWWIITTAGDDPDRTSIGWEQHEYAEKLIAGEYKDPTWYPVIFGYQGDDIYNEENWALANPSLGTTIQLETVREAANRARMKPAEERLFRWLRLNQWITTKLTTWLPLELFDQTVGDWSPVELAGKSCYIGLDLSTTTDLSAIALIFPPQDGFQDWRILWEAWIPAANMEDRIKTDRIPYDLWSKAGYVTATEGDVIDYQRIRDRILELAGLYQVREVVADPAFATMLLQELEGKGLNVVTVPQNYTNLTDPMNLVEVLLRTRQMSHISNPLARWAFGNVSIAQNGSGLKKYVKESKGRTVIRTKRIDPMAALITGMCRARFSQANADLSAAILDPEWGF